MGTSDRIARFILDALESADTLKKTILFAAQFLFLDLP